MLWISNPVIFMYVFGNFILPYLFSEVQWYTCFNCGFLFVFLFIIMLLFILLNLWLRVKFDGTALSLFQGQATDIERPEEFDTYLKALLAFTQHPSLVRPPAPPPFTPPPPPPTDLHHHISRPVTLSWRLKYCFCISSGWLSRSILQSVNSQ